MMLIMLWIKWIDMITTTMTTKLLNSFTEL